MTPRLVLNTILKPLPERFNWLSFCVVASLGNVEIEIFGDSATANGTRSCSWAMLKPAAAQGAADLSEKSMSSRYSEPGLSVGLTKGMVTDFVVCAAMFKS